METDDERMWDAIPLPLLIKGRGRGSAAPLDQSGHRGRRESRPTRCPNQQRPGFPPPTPATLGHMASKQNRGDGRGDRSPPRDRGARTP